MAPLDKLPTLFIAFWDFNGKLKVFNSVGECIKHIMAQGRQITGK
jgi:hypothetical protein